MNILTVNQYTSGHQYKLYRLQTIVLFKRLGSRSRHVHKEIKLHKVVNGMGKGLGKMGPILIRRLTYNCNTFNHVDFEAFSKSAYAHLWYSQFQ